MTVRRMQGLGIPLSPLCGGLAMRVHRRVLAIPATLYSALQQIIPFLLRGDAVSLVPVHQQLTTQQAADFLNVSRPHPVKLLNDGLMPYTRVGSHRRIYFRDVVEYKRRRDAERRKALDEMVALSEQFGIYD
jgi:excisionase family DNA binding protein